MVGLAQTLARLKYDAPLRQRLGEAARAAVVPDHTWDAVARRVLSLVGAPQAI
jgi:glycosyltransferase involved in cell wall biosynthesis